MNQEIKPLYRIVKVNYRICKLPWERFFWLQSQSLRDTWYTAFECDTLDEIRVYLELSQDDHLPDITEINV